jgi:hypothetical protein
MKEIIRYVVLFKNAYGDVVERLLTRSKVDKWIKNWGFQYNGDKSGLEVHEITYDSRIQDE